MSQAPSPAPDWMVVEGSLLDPDRCCLPLHPFPEALRRGHSTDLIDKRERWMSEHLPSGWGTKITTLCGRPSRAWSCAYFEEEVRNCPHCLDLQGQQP